MPQLAECESDFLLFMHRDGDPNLGNPISFDVGAQALQTSQVRHAIQHTTIGLSAKPAAYVDPGPGVAQNRVNDTLCVGIGTHYYCTTLVHPVRSNPICGASRDHAQRDCTAQT